MLLNDPTFLVNAMKDLNEKPHDVQLLQRLTCERKKSDGNTLLLCCSQEGGIGIGKGKADSPCVNG